MGYGYMAYAVPLGLLSRYYGSGDEATFLDLARKCRLHPSDDDDGEGLSRYEALRHLVMGLPTQAGQGHQYAYATKAVIETLGPFLNNNALLPCGSGPSDEIDAALNQMGVTLRLSHFLSSSLPVSLPRPDDFPFYGYIRKEDIGQHLQQLRTTPYLGGVSWISDAIETLTEWLEICFKMDRSLVVFYH